MGEDAASAVLRNLSERDIHTLTRELSDIGVIPQEMMQQVLEEYHKQANAGPQGMKAGPDFAGRLLAKAFGPEQAKGMIAKVTASQDSAAAQVQALRKADPSQLAKFLGVEHPQTIALTLAHLDEKQVAAVLTKMPEQTRAEAVKRLAQLRQFSPEIAERVSSVLNRRLQALGEQSRKSYAGFKSVADVLNRMESGVAKSILDALEQEDANLAISIRNFMFTFEDLLGVADVAIREWLGTMDKKTLALALKGASDNLKDHIFRSMSSRAADMLKEDMEALGPVRNKDVIQAQQEAVALLRNLEAEGKVVLRSEGDDEYVV
jgi:flagellar motor switch protein FliG